MSIELGDDAIAITVDEQQATLYQPDGAALTLGPNNRIIQPTLELAVYNVSPSYNQSATEIEDALAVAVAAGFTRLACFMSPNYDGSQAPPRYDFPIETWPKPATSLLELAKLAPFATYFSHPRVTHYFLKTWTFATGIYDPWRQGTTAAILSAEYQEIYDLALHLRTTYPAKTFVIQTSESDWALIGAFDPSVPVPPERLTYAMQFFTQRVKAVRDAVGASSGGRVYSAIEINRVLDAPGQLRVHSDVIPLMPVKPDLIALSIYEAVNGWLTGLNQAQSLIDIDTKVRQVAAAVRAFNGTVPLYLGEFGWPEAAAQFQGTLDVSAFADQLLTTAQAIGIYWASFWQLWGNDVGPIAGLPVGVSTGQAVYSQAGPITKQGRDLVTRLPLDDDTLSLALTGGQYANLGQPADIDINPTVDDTANELTVSVWFKASSLQLSVIMARGLLSGPSGIDYDFSLELFGDGRVLASYGNGTLQSAAGAYAAGAWHHAAVTLRASSRGSDTGARLYLDGVLVSNLGHPVTHAPSKVDWLIGNIRNTNNADVSAFPFAGHLDEITIWRRGLTAAEVSALRSAGKPINPWLHTQAASLAHYYRCGERDTPSRMLDRAGSAHAALVGSPTYAADVP